jgi:uncharacterized membrane protein
MRTHARWARSGVHPVLGFLSLGLLATSVLFDVAGLASRQTVWADAARRDLQLGLAGGAAASVFVLAAVFGSLSGSPARRMAVLRAAAHLVSLTLFAGALALRRARFPSTAAVVLAAGGLALGGIGAWLGTEIAARLDDG